MDDGEDPENSMVPVPGRKMPESDQFPPISRVPFVVNERVEPGLIVKSPDTDK